MSPPLRVKSMLSKVNVTTALRLAQRCYNLQQLTGERYVLNLLGPAGQGKTALNNDHRDHLANLLVNRTVALKSYRLNQSDPTDLKGVPMYHENEDGLKTCEWAVPQIFPVIGSPHSGKADFTLFLFDEFNQAAQSMQNLAANVIDQIVGDQTLDYTRYQIILAGNRTEDGAAVYALPTNLKTRLITVQLENTLDDWIKWATQNNIHPGIIGYLKNFSIAFNDTTSTSEYSSHPNPRTWHRLSSDITFHDDWAADEDSRIMAIGLLGEKVGSAFYSFFQKFSAEFSIDKIMEQGGKVEMNYKELEFVYTIIVELAYRVTKILQTAMESLSPDDRKDSEAVSSILTHQDYQHILNVYDWLHSADFPKPIKLLLGTFINQTEYNMLMRLIRLDPKLDKAGIQYSEITKQLHAI